jgi:hypothetical protein
MGSQDRPVPVPDMPTPQRVRRPLWRRVLIVLLALNAVGVVLGVVLRDPTTVGTSVTLMVVPLGVLLLGDRLAFGVGRKPPTDSHDA